jgi:DNA-binding transcriptional ArsR family regulator
MKKIVLKHLTILGYMNGVRLNECGQSARKLEEAQVKLKEAKRKVKEAKSELKQALENSIEKIKAEKALKK